MKCTVCSHPQCHDINLAILAGNSSFDALQEQFGPSRSALFRHKKHLLEKVDRAETRIENNLRLGYLFQLNTYQKAAAATVAAAQAEANSRLTLQAVNSGARIITSMNKLEVDLGRETTYRLLAAPEYVQPDCLLPGDPHILAGPRRSLTRSLFSACPEADPAELFDLDDLEDWIKIALESDSETGPEQPRQLELPNFLTPPAPEILPQTSSKPRSTKTGNYPKSKRDKTETKARQTPSCSINFEENQKDTQDDQKSATNLAFDPEKAAPPAKVAGWAPDLIHGHAGQPPEIMPPAEVPVLDDSHEILPEPLAAELAAFLKNFAPYAQSAQGLDASTSQLPETANREPETVFSPPPAVSAMTDESDIPNLIPGNLRLEAVFPSAPPPSSPAPAPCPADPQPLAPEHCHSDSSSRSPDRCFSGEPGRHSKTSDELFLMTHGYPRDNPPKHIPNRHRDQNFRGFSLFREIKEHFM